MRFLRVAIWAVLILSASAVIGSYPAEAYFASKAKLYQLVEPSEAAQLFGDVGNLVGSAQLMIVEDPKAVLPGKSPNGAILLNDKYMHENGIYPLQLKTVRYFGYWVRLVGGGATLLCGLSLLLINKRQRGAKQP